LGYEATLQRGYAVVRSDGDVITTKAAAQNAAQLDIQFADGTITLGAAPKRRKPRDTPPEQGELL
jgi:exodeoxyribonuclease VII large subunit